MLFKHVEQRFSLSFLCSYTQRNCHFGCQACHSSLYFGQPFLNSQYHCHIFPSSIALHNPNPNCITQLMMNFSSVISLCVQNFNHQSDFTTVRFVYFYTHKCTTMQRQKKCMAVICPTDQLKQPTMHKLISVATKTFSIPPVILIL